MGKRLGELLSKGNGPLARMLSKWLNHQKEKDQIKIKVPSKPLSVGPKTPLVTRLPKSSAIKTRTEKPNLVKGEPKPDESGNSNNKRD